MGSRTSIGAPVDWSKHDGTSESYCTCRCVYSRLKDGDEVPTFRSHVKYVAGVGLVSRKPCPDCGRTDNLQSAGGDWEPM